MRRHQSDDKTAARVGADEMERKSPILGSMLVRREATAADAELITAHRKAMFASMGDVPEMVLDTMGRSFEAWVARMMAAGRYRGWVICNDRKAVASAGLLVMDWPPHPLDPTGERRGYLLNIFVEPLYRRRGLAHDLVEMCLSEARRRGIRVVTLHTSGAGRPLYESFGFRGSGEMLYVIPER